MRVAALAYGAQDGLQWGRKDKAVDFYDAKGDVEALLAPLRPRFEPAAHPALHPGRCARVLLGGQAIGFVGELHPQWRQSWDLPAAPVLFELELDAVLQRQLPAFRAVAKRQLVERDIAVVVAERVTHDEVMHAIGGALPGELLRSAVLFDVFRPQPQRSGEAAPAGSLAQGEKSLAIRLTLGSEVEALTDAQIEAAVQTVLQALADQTGARLR